VRVFASSVCRLVIIKSDFALSRHHNEGVGKQSAWPFNAKRSLWIARTGVVERQTGKEAALQLLLSLAVLPWPKGIRRVEGWKGVRLCMCVDVCRGGKVLLIHHWG